MFIPCLLILQVLCVLHPDGPLFILIKPFFFLFFSPPYFSAGMLMFSHWEWCNGCKELRWGLVFSIFPVQTLGELQEMR